MITIDSMTEQECKATGGHGLEVTKYDGDYVYSCCKKCNIFSKEKAEKTDTTAIKTFLATVRGRVTKSTKSIKQP